MSSLLKKILYTGVGAAALAKKKADNLKDGLLEKGKSSEEKGQQLMEDYNELRKDRQHIIQEEIGAIVEKTLRKMNIPTRSEVKVLEKRIKALEKALSEKSSDNE